MRPEAELAGEAAGARSIIARIAKHGWGLTAASLAAATALAWWWLAGMGGLPMEEGGPGMPAMHSAGDAWLPAYLISAFGMWALMMVAMMLPSAAPMILLYERFVRRSGAGNAFAKTAVFTLAYVGIWTLFSAAAAVAQAALISTGLVSEMALRIGDGRIAGGLVIFAGVYQLSPLKRACLEECRSPLSFLMRLWRPGAAGALRMGLAHGAYCLGCCWALMLLLFVGGVMSIAWIAALGVLVLVEKLAPVSVRARKVIAAALVGAGAMLVIGVSIPA